MASLPILATTTAKNRIFSNVNRERRLGNGRAGETEVPISHRELSPLGVIEVIYEDAF